jgi:phosphate transport system protein
VRSRFAEQLDELRGLLVMTAASVTSSIRWATDGLVNGDLEPAMKAVDTAVEAKSARICVGKLIHQLLVRQQPVASDLRLALAGLQVAADLERMAVLADHIAKIVIRRHPVPVIPPETQPIVRRMGEIAEELAWTVTRVLEVSDIQAASKLDQDDDKMDALHRDMFETLFSDWRHGVQAAVDLALIGRFYERYADHAVSAGHQVVFLITGHAPAQ